MHRAEKCAAVQVLIAQGLTDPEIEKAANVPRATVRNWRHRPKLSNRVSAKHPCGTDHDFTALPAGPYCYLLGLYLGDGCIALRRGLLLFEALDVLLPPAWRRKKHERRIVLKPWQEALVRESPMTSFEVLFTVTAAEWLP